MNAPDGLVRAPGVQVPAGACDCHMHVYDHRYPAVNEAALTPSDASVDQYRALQARLGTERTVVVTPSTYGTDDQCLLDALPALGAQARGIAVVTDNVTDAQLRRLATLGVRGIRFNQSLGRTTTLEMLEPLADRIAAFGWHVQLLMPAESLPAIEPVLRRLPVPVVFDHFARVPADAGVAHPAFAVIANLLSTGRAWIKLSGGYIVSPDGRANHPRVAALAKAYLAVAPERIVWGSDWPHASAQAGHQPMPDDSELLGLLARWSDDDSLFARVLVDNPQQLYGFDRVTTNS